MKCNDVFFSNYYYSSLSANQVGRDPLLKSKLSPLGSSKEFLANSTNAVNTVNAVNATNMANSANAGTEDFIKPVSNEEFQAMIPAHFTSNGAEQRAGSSVVISVKQPDNVVAPAPPAPPVGGSLGELNFPAVPTQLGKVTETITKSTLTETIVTRITNNKLGALPIIIEVN